MANFSGPSIVTANLVFISDPANVKEYPGSGTAFSDISPSKLTGTIRSPGFSPVGPAFNTSNYGNMVYNGANNQVIEYGDNLDMGTSDFTLCAWVKSTWAVSAGGNNNGVIYKRGTGTTVSAGYRLSFAGGIFNFWVADGTVGEGGNSTGGWNTGNWVNVQAVAVRGSSLKIYINGVLDTTFTHTTSLTVDNTIEFGRGALYIAGSVYHPFTGSIGQVHVYNRALSADEVLRNYNSLRGRYGL